MKQEFFVLKIEIILSMFNQAEIDTSPTNISLDDAKFKVIGQIRILRGAERFEAKLEKNVLLENLLLEKTVFCYVSTNVVKSL